MKKNRLKQIIPSIAWIKKSKEFKKIKSYLNTFSVWEYDANSISRGVAAGLAGCVIPGIQFFYAAFLAVLLRGNIVIALLATFVTNVFTVAPITYFIYYIGSLILQSDKQVDQKIQTLHWDFSSFHALWFNISEWLLQFSKAFLIGLPIVSLSLGILGYLGAMFIQKMGYFIRKNIS